MESNPLHCTLTDSELSEKAQYWIDSLVKSGGKTFVMHVPARPNEDPDLIFAELDQRFLAKCFELASLKAQPSAVWVKAKERLPEPFKVVPCKYTPDSPDPRKDTELHWGFVSKEGVWSRLWQNHQVEWLDESAAGREDAVEFAKFLDEQRSSITPEMWNEKVIWRSPEAFQEWLQYFKQQKEK